VGLSSPDFLEGKYLGTNTRIDFISGAVFDIAPRWKLRPTTHVTMTNGTPISVDLNLAAIYNKKIWLGAMHRFNDSFGAFVQYQITSQFKVGMAYDQTVFEFAGYNKGTKCCCLAILYSRTKESVHRVISKLNSIQ